MFNLKEGSVALVTGGARGIGNTIAEQLAQHGARILIIDINGDAAEEAAKNINSAGGEAMAIAGDIRIKADCKRFADAAMEKWGRIDILVNNAIVLRDNTIRKMSEEEWDIVVDIGLKGTFLMTQAVVEIMREQKFGRVINLTSPAFNGKFGQPNYASAKGAVNSLTRCTAVEYARFNVTANAIAPGFIDTPGNRELPPELFERLTQLTPAKCPGKTIDIANCALFLASEQSGYITGQVIFVDGGITLGQ